MSATSSPTLHRLLWGVNGESQSFEDWAIRPFEIPAVGLPIRVATSLYVAAQRCGSPRDWSPSSGPLIWRLTRGSETLLVGRSSQFFEQDSEQSSSTSPSKISIEKSIDWEIDPHPAYYLPLVNTKRIKSIKKREYVQYCDILLLLTAIDGGEAILDRIFESGVGIVPFMDRWAWRSRIHLPIEMWEAIDRTIRWSGSPSNQRVGDKNSFIERLDGWFKNEISLSDFKDERIDISLDLQRDFEIVRTVQSSMAQRGSLSQELRLQKTIDRESLVVRIGQVAEWVDQSKVVRTFPVVDTNIANTIMKQVESAFGHPCRSGASHEPDLVVFPELSIPTQQLSALRDLVKSTGRSALAGLYWRELPPVYGSRRTIANTRWFVNEAELIIPINYGGRGPTSVRWFRVRKPIPAHLEVGLASALTSCRSATWRILEGQRWYRFLHPEWGDFSVAICADLLDPSPWYSLCGEILHLFMVAFNRDADLYESLTWFRAYENYVNIVAVNHGSYGGSFLWTPRRRHDRELARLRGGNLYLVADVEVPIAELLQQQRKGVRDAITDSADAWNKVATPSPSFKSPPPKFIRRALADPD